MERHRCVPVFNIVSVFKTTSTSAVTPPSFKTGIVKKKKITLIYFVPACVHLRVCSRSKALMWNSENSLWELVSSFYLVGPGNWTQLVRLCSGHLYLLTHLTYKIWFFFFLISDLTADFTIDLWQLLVFLASSLANAAFHLDSSSHSAALAQADYFIRHSPNLEWAVSNVQSDLTDGDTEALASQCRWWLGA